jgi:hypothetical protein
MALTPRQHFTELFKHIGWGDALIVPSKQADINVGAVVLYINDTPHDIRRVLSTSQSVGN